MDNRADEFKWKTELAIRGYELMEADGLIEREVWIPDERRLNLHWKKERPEEEKQELMKRYYAKAIAEDIMKNGIPACLTEEDNQEIEKVLTDFFLTKVWLKKE